MLKGQSYLTQPTIIRIPVLLRELLAGELQIPRFQRPDVWKPEQRLKLLESIYRGYPIGSILIWRTRKHSLACFDKIGGITIPQGGDESPRDLKQYVLDGHQRLSTLLSTLGRGLLAAHAVSKPSVEGAEEIYFDVAADSDPFRQASARDVPQATWLPMSAIFDHYARSQFKDALIKSDKQMGGRWAVLVEDLAELFRDYVVPVVPLVTEDLTWVTESFRRVNNAGTVMNEVHMVHALSWGQEFDLNRRLEDFQAEFKALGWYDLEADTFLTTCKAIGKLDPSTTAPDKLLKKIQEDPSLLERVCKSLKAAMAFLKQPGIGVEGAKVLPYEAQLLALAFIASEHAYTIPADQQEALRRWFWVTTYTGYVYNSAKLRKVLNIIRKWLQGDQELIPADIDRRIEPLSRVNLSHSARSRAFALRLAEQRPRGPDGAVLRAGALLAEFGGDALLPIVPRSQMKGAETRPENQMLIEASQAEALRAVFCGQSQLDGAEVRREVLRSHLIDEEAEEALCEQRWEDFLRLRRERICKLERDFVGELGLEFVAEPA